MLQSYWSTALSMYPRCHSGAQGSHRTDHYQLYSYTLGSPRHSIWRLGWVGCIGNLNSSAELLAKDWTLGGVPRLKETRLVMVEEGQVSCMARGLH
jgi:hypothetical protein